MPNEEHDATPFTRIKKHRPREREPSACSEDQTLISPREPDQPQEDGPGQDKGTFWRDAVLSGAIWLLTVFQKDTNHIPVQTRPESVGTVPPKELCSADAVGQRDLSPVNTLGFLTQEEISSVASRVPLDE